MSSSSRIWPSAQPDSSRPGSILPTWETAGQQLSRTLDTVLVYVRGGCADPPGMLRRFPASQAMELRALPATVLMWEGPWSKGATPS